MPYPSDLTDEQWDLIKPDIVRRKRRGQQAKDYEAWAHLLRPSR